MPQGYHQTVVTKAKHSQSLRQYYADHPEARVKKSRERRQYYIDHPEEKNKIAERVRQHWAILTVAEKRERCRRGCEVAVSILKGKPQPDAVIERRVQGMIGHPVSERARRNMSVAQKKRWHSAEYREQQVIAGKKRWQNPDFFEKVLQSRNMKPNKPELHLQDILDRHFPGQWKFVGDGQVNLGGQFPDFINIDGKKEVIELFGSYWHQIFDIAKKKDHYRQYGFRVAIIWEDELGDEGRLVKLFEKKFR